MPRLNLKKMFVRPENIAKEIVAFASSQADTLLIGVSDDGKVKGVQEGLIIRNTCLISRAITLFRP